MIDQPHYKVPGRMLEPIEVLYKGLTAEEFRGYCIGNIVKYIMRYPFKGGCEDLEKAKTYINFLLITEEEENDLNKEKEE